VSLYHKKWLVLFIACLVVQISCSEKKKLKWKNESGYRWAEVSTSFFEDVGFDKIDPSVSNIHFKNHLSNEEVAENRILFNGSGVAVGDVDGDGRVDVYFASLTGTNKLYKNLGAFHFKDITQEAGVAHEGYHSTGVVLVDVDGDRDLDLLVTSLLEKNVLYINDGKGHFEIKKESGLGKSNGSTSMALADVDGDNDLDLYITNYKKKSARDILSPSQRSLKNTVKPVSDSFKVISPFDKYYTMIFTEDRPYRKEYGERDQLYLNNGGVFEKIEDLDSHFLDQNGKGIGLSRDWGLTAMFHDLNNDNRPDLYVCNDFWTPDRIWINQGEGIFKKADSLMVRNFSYSSMAVDFSDINRDGAVDFFVSEMLSPVHERRMRQFSQYLGAIDHHPQYNKNSLYLNREDSTFMEIANYSGLEASGWSWATNFIDVDLDGYEDLVIATGNILDVEDLDTQFKLNRQIAQNKNMEEGILEYPSLNLPNKLFRNNHDLTFSDISKEWGFDEEDVSQGMALADLDNDGDYDLITNRLNKTAGLFKNVTSAPRIAVRLKGKKGNTQAIGAKIKLTGGKVIQKKEVVSGGRYLSGSTSLVVFAGKENATHILEVRWRDGSKSVIDSVRTGRIYEVDQSKIAASQAKRDTNNSKQEKKYIFKDVSERINYQHKEKEFDDLKVQPLLPVNLSEQGPGVSWIDFDRDGDDDLFIGSGKGYEMGIFENIGEERFEAIELQRLKQKAIGDQTTLVGWNSQKGVHILVGNSNYESPNSGIPPVTKYLLNSTEVVNQKDLPSSFSATGPIALTDYDGDQDLDLFIGGRLRPGIYPMNANSRLFKNIEGHFELDEKNSKILKNIGLVTSAVFTDYDRDGDQDLLIAREWDSILLLENNDGIFHDVSKEAGLSHLKGWWKGIATGDFNNDGLPDFVVTNLGLNSAYKTDSQAPLKMYYNDLNQDGVLDIIEAYYSQAKKSYVPRRKFYDFDSMYLGNIKSHRQYARSSISEIFNRDFKKIPVKEINTLESTLFINKGGHFEAESLPQKAQLSAGFGINVLDFDNDGNEDVFIAQNFFGFATKVPRLDAGLGLLLKGDGKGNFKALPSKKTGIKIYGEQRGSATSDFNQDGKVDLVVGQNGGEVKLFLNQSEKHGIKVHLIGPTKNKDAVGSSLQLVYEDGSQGPVREVRAGSGYWSQSGFTNILGIGKGKNPVYLKVKWPAGSDTSVAISKSKMNYEISYN